MHDAGGCPETRLRPTTTERWAASVDVVCDPMTQGSVPLFDGFDVELEIVKGRLCCYPVVVDSELHVEQPDHKAGHGSHECQSG